MLASNVGIRGSESFGRAILNAEKTLAMRFIELHRRFAEWKEGSEIPHSEPADREAPTGTKGVLIPTAFRSDSLAISLSMLS